MTLGIEHRSVGPMDNNAYLVTDASSGERLLIDAAAEPDAIADLIGEGRLRWLLTTHSHHDHIGALAATAAAHPEATIVCGDADADAISAATGVPIGHRLHDGDTLSLGEHVLDVIGLRGHTVGSVALAVPIGPVVNLFTGDSLFPGGVGNTNRDPVRFASLLGDVVARIFDRYDDATVVWPGHGLPTTLGAERPHLEEWRARGW
jgi:glyoxylase-like metal-dependent hydrolase (beta-lactamase superfamily II)